MTESVTVALLASVVGPCVFATVQWWLRRADVKATHAREDAVKERVEEVVVQAAEAARLLKEKNESDKQTAAQTQEKLDTIHGLVNSTMTAQKQDTLDSKRRELASLKELVEVRRQLGQAPSPETLAEIEATELSVEELTAELLVRLRQTKASDL